jgi:tetratricopeptide (TPR) repeat protein
VKQRTFRIPALILLVTAAAAVFGQVGGFAFVSIDDGAYVTENPHVREGLSREGVSWAFRAGRSGHWHPTTWLSHMLDVELFGLWAGGHHLMNLLIHLANTLVLLGLLERMTGSFWRSLTVAALFAFHPAHVETVAWVADRKDLLSTLFGLLAVRAYVEYARDTRAVTYLASLLLFAVALGAKSMVVTLPLLLLLLDHWPLRRGRTGRGDVQTGKASDGSGKRATGARWVPLILEKVPFLMLSLGASLATLQTMTGGNAKAWADDPLSARLAHALSSCLHQVIKTVDPVNLAVHYPARATIPMWEWAAGLFVLCAGTALVLYLRRRLPYALTGWFWFLTALLPVSGLVHIGGTPWADRYTYLPHIGLFILLAWGAADLAERCGSVRLRALLRCSGVALLSILCLLSFRQVGRWRDSRTLFEHAVRVSPRSVVARNNLGLALASQGRPRQAASQFREALRIRPDSAEAHRNLGIALARMGRVPEAAAHLEAAARLRPEGAEVRSYLARCYLVLGRIRAAEAACRRALTREPGHPRALVNLGEALLRQGKGREAEEAYRRGLRRFRGDVARPMGGLASALAAQGRWIDAVAVRRQLLRMRPGSGENWYRLAVESYLMGDRASAVRCLRRARELGYQGLEADFLERLQ